MKYWRLFSDSTVEWKGQDMPVALSYDIGTEQMADQPCSPRTFWMSSALFTEEHITGPWSVAVRPEFYWDRNGRMTQFERFIWANTTTLEYRRHFWGIQQAIMRIEHRYVRSTGDEGGFFRNGEIVPGAVGLARDQHLLLLSLIWAFDY